MRKFSFYHLLFFCACVIADNAFSAESAAPQKTILVVTFPNNAAPDSKLDNAIQQAKREFDALESIPLSDEHALTSLLESKTDGSIGLVVLIHPQNAELLGKLPALYPDLQFSLIDAEYPSFAANVQSVIFKEDEGAFLLGAIAAIRTHDHVAIMALEETERGKRLMESFRAGAHHIHPDLPITLQTHIKPSSTQRTRIATTVDTAFQEGTSMIFSMDDEIIEYALRAAKPERKLVISGNPPLASIDTSRLLTYMVKRYDLAMLDVLHIYAHKQWHAGTISLGVSRGYIDYSLNADNVDIFPKDSIDQIEAIKDHIAQGVLGNETK